MKPFFYRAIEVIKKSYTGNSLLLQIIALALTCVIVLSGFDWLYFLSVRNESLNALFFPALPVGFFFPILLPVALLVVGHISKNTRTLREGVMLAYAAFAGWFISSTYKAFTGRVQPDLYDLSVDSSRNFNFGFLEHGIFWGWPSSHTAVAFATMTALFLIVPKRSWVRWAAVAYAFYIGIGVSLSIHWFSEFVAGALIGIAVGVAVEETWRKKSSEALYWKYMKHSTLVIIAVLLLGGAAVYMAKNKPSAPSVTPSAGSSTVQSTLASSPETATVAIAAIDTVPSAAPGEAVYKGTGTTSVAVRITGSIKNMKLVAVELDGPELATKDTLKDFGDISNGTIYIMTTIPEGTPAEMLIWQSEKETTYTWVVGANGETGSIDRTYEVVE